jgi:hypothetical protein
MVVFGGGKVLCGLCVCVCVCGWVSVCVRCWCGGAKVY